MLLAAILPLGENNNNDDDYVNVDIVEGNDDNWTTTMRWRQVQLDDNDVRWRQ